MFKKITLVVMIIVMSLGCVPIANAAAVSDESVVQPLYDYTSATSTTLSISGSTATCTGYVAGNSSVTKIYITLTLQKKTLLWWNDVEEWSVIHANKTAGSLTKSVSVGSGTYRVKAVYRVFSGTASETITKYSSEKSC